MSEECTFEGKTSHCNRRFRDEMNFAEFPIAALSDSLPGGQKTLVFSDTIFDRSRNAEITRKLTITASDEYGLPTAYDDEVILGLIQLTAKTNFEERKVYFTRRELIRELSWRDESKSYARIELSLKRWLGVTLYYDKAWRSNEEQCWVDESFHILDRVTILDRERITRRVKALPDDPNAGLSSFQWNEVVFNSFRAGYIKRLDFALYKTLKSHIAKRMFRFLDKRFYHDTRLHFDLCEFAFTKIGVSRKCHTGEIKRRLRPAIAELEELGFIKALAPSERFIRHARGEWGIVFVKAGKKSGSPGPESPDNILARELIERGVSTQTAASLVRTHTKEVIEDKISFVDWLRGRADPRISKNAAGFLVKAIRENYPVPDEMRLEAEVQVQRANQKVQLQAAASNADRSAREKELKEMELRVRLDSFWNALSGSERKQIEQEALRAADKFLRDQYEKGKGRGGPLFDATRRAILDKELKRRTIAESFEFEEVK